MKIWKSAWLCALAVSLCVLSCGSDSEPGDPGIPDWDGEFEVDPPRLPELTPCPEGWSELPPSEATGVVVCEPWPDGDPVSPPVLTPCPEGWRDVTDEATGIVTCDPWPESGRESCPAVDEAHFPGEPGCARIGPACPAGQWAEDLPDDGTVLYVDDEALPGGTGTMAEPFATIAEATDAAEEGTIVALGRGTYDEVVEVPRGVTLWGACVAETIVTCSETSTEEATLRSIGADSAIRNLQVGGERFGVDVGRWGRTLDLENVLVANAAFAGVSVVQGTLTGRNVIVRSTNPRPGGSDFGFGITVEYDGTVELQRVAVEENLAVGVNVGTERATLTLTDAVIADTQGLASGLYGHGISVHSGATAELERVVLENNRAGAAGVGDAGSTLILHDTIIRDTQSQGDGLLLGHGLDVIDGGHLQLERVLVERNRLVGVYVRNDDSRLDAVDFVVRDTLAQEADGLFGTGLNVEHGGTAYVQRGAFHRNRYYGVGVADEGSLLDLTDVEIGDNLSAAETGEGGRGLTVQEGGRLSGERIVLDGNREVGLSVQRDATATLADIVIRNTEFSALGEYGRGLAVTDGARLELTRALLEGNLELALDIMGADTSATMTDIVARDTRSNESDSAYGRGLEVYDGALAVVQRSLFERNRDVCISTADEGTRLELVDVVVRDTERRESDGQLGRGLNVQGGSQVDVEGAVFERNLEAGVVATGPGSTVSLRNVTIVDTQECECADPRCTNRCAAVGVASLGEAAVQMEQFLVSRNAACGVVLGFGFQEDEETLYDRMGSMDLSHGEVSHHPICGVDLIESDYDLSRLTDHVIYRDNGRNLNTSGPLPLQSSASPISEL